MRPVLIAGPTASGKSALALALAERDGGCVINADALQVYACWRVLTARPDSASCARAPHHLYGHVPGDAAYSVGAWLREVGPGILAAQARGQRPIIVGGAGLYFQALTSGLVAIPPIPPDVRVQSQTLLDAGGVEALVADLARDDPATLARIDRVNPMRVQRGWEVLTATGRGLSDWHGGASPPLLPLDETIPCVVEQDITFLNNRIESRFETMMEDGALEECADFLAVGYDLRLPSGRALGAAELVGYIEERATPAHASAAAVTATRQYAKRQRTWFSNRMRTWPRIDPTAGDALGQIPRA